MEMTDQEIALADRKILAEIVRMQAETQKLLNEAIKVKKESDWYLLVIGSGVTLAIVAIAKLFL